MPLSKRSCQHRNHDRNAGQDLFRDEEDCPRPGKDLFHGEEDCHSRGKDLFRDEEDGHNRGKDLFDREYNGRDDRDHGIGRAKDLVGPGEDGIRRVQGLLRHEEDVLLNKKQWIHRSELAARKPETGFIPDLCLLDRAPFYLSSRFYELRPSHIRIQSGNTA